MPLPAIAIDAATVALDTATDDVTRRVDEQTTPAEMPADAFALVSGVTPAEGTSITIIEDPPYALTSSRANSRVERTPPKALVELRVREGKMVSEAVSPMPQIQVVEQWHGVVEEVQHDGFYARVLTGDGASVPEEEGYFPLSMVSDDDQQLVHEGAFFTYTIGRENRYGTRVNMSVLAFRRMPMWHLRQVAEAKNEGKRIADYLKQATESDRIGNRAAGD